MPMHGFEQMWIWSLGLAKHAACLGLVALIASSSLAMAQQAAPPSSSPVPAIGQEATPPSTSPAPATGQTTTPASTPPSSAVGEAAPLLPVVGSAHLPRDLSPWSMFMQADILVQGVMVGLVFASLVTWTVYLAKSIEFVAAMRRLRRAMAVVVAARSLVDAHDRLKSSRGIVPMLVNASALELDLSSDVADSSGIKERIAARLARLESMAGREMNKGTGVLATIGATAPFVGLFGTVWGIMNSFIGISKAQTTNLAVVAPGIAEALLATAIGLFAAIPAVIIYNQLARKLAGYKALVGDAAAEVHNLASRDLDRGQSGHIGRKLSRAAE